MPLPAAVAEDFVGGGAVSGRMRSVASSARRRQAALARRDAVLYSAATEDDCLYSIPWCSRKVTVLIFMQAA